VLVDHDLVLTAGHCLRLFALQEFDVRHPVLRYTDSTS
jgi:hypothetical protein